MAKLVTNVVKSPYKFKVRMKSGDEYDFTVMAESLDAAALLLPENTESWKLVTK